MGLRSDDALVVVPVTPRPVPPADPGQLDLFGPPPDTVPAPRSPTGQEAISGRDESNDLDLIRHVAGNAARGLYLLVGTAARVYARSDDGTTTVAARPARTDRSSAPEPQQRRAQRGDPRLGQSAHPQQIAMRGIALIVLSPAGKEQLHTQRMLQIHLRPPDRPACRQPSTSRGGTASVVCRK
jgi:hypothetical protein